MKFLTFIFGLVIGIVAAYGAVAADVLELPFLNTEDEIVVEEPVEVEEEEEDNLIIEGYSYDPELNVIPFAGEEYDYKLSDEFVTMVEETEGVIVSRKLPYAMDKPELVYVLVGYDLVDTEIENRTEFFEYNLSTNEYSKKFEYKSDNFVAIPRGIDGQKLVYSKSAVDYGPPVCANPWSMWEQYYFDLEDVETVAAEYDLPERLQAEVELSLAECEFLQDLTGFKYPVE